MNHPLHTFVVLAYNESEYLETCIKSVLNQTVKSEVIIATTTPNQHIKSLAKKYNLKITTGTHTNIGGDFDFAVNSAATPLVTVAHQDDIYEPTYAEKVIKAHQKYQDATIIFTDYFEIRRDKKVFTNTNLKIKRILLLPLKSHALAKTYFAKRFALCFGSAICCPAVTFIRKNCPKKIFASDFKSDVDWHTWETLSRKKGRFIFIPEKLMGHRISESSTTTDIINQGIRTKEDFIMFQRFWPRFIAKFLTKLYSHSEKSNQLD